MTVFTPTAEELNTVQVPFDVATIRADFPILARDVNGKPLVYLDNGASAQKPKVVLDTIQRAYGEEYANVHRGLHYLEQPLDRQFRGGARERAPLRQRAAPTRRSSSPATPPKRSTWSPRPMARSNIGRGRRDRDHDHGASLQHRAVAFPARAAGRGAEMGAGRDEGEFLLDEFERLISPHQDRCYHPHVQRARHHRRRSRRWCASRMPTASPSWSTAPGRGAPAGRRSGPRLSISMPSPATSSTGRPVSACSTARSSMLETMPPYQGGGEMIGDVTLETRSPMPSRRIDSRRARRRSSRRSGSALRSTM